MYLPSSIAVVLDERVSSWVRLRAHRVFVVTAVLPIVCTPHPITVACRLLPASAYAPHGRRSNMADRDYYDDRERARGYEESRGSFGRDRDRQIERNWSDRNRDTDDRGAVSRGADEVRSWFGDDEARRRREMDERRDRV